MSPVQPSITPPPKPPPPPKDHNAATYDAPAKATYAGEQGSK